MRIVPIILAALSATGGVEAETLRLATDPDFFEELLPEARISGSLVAGIQHQGASGNLVAVAADVPADWAGDVACARVVSIDGTYAAVNEYTVPADWTGGPADLNYPTAYSDLLNGAAHDGIGVRVSRGSCDGLAEQLAIASWNDGADVPPAILVNSFQADTVFAYVGETANPVRCVPVDLDGRSAYDVRCPLVTLPDGASVTVDLLRITDGQAAPKTSLVLWLPGR